MGYVTSYPDAPRRIRVFLLYCWGKAGESTGVDCGDPASGGGDPAGFVAAIAASRGAGRRDAPAIFREGRIGLSDVTRSACGWPDGAE